MKFPLTRDGTALAFAVLCLSSVLPSPIPAAASPGAGADAASAARASGVASGLCVVVGAAETALAETLAADGRMAVDLLTAGDDARADAWRDRLDQAGRGGLVSVVPMQRFASLPYADRFANLVIADLDALAGDAPADKELRRIVAPYGALCLRKGGAWKTEKILLAPDLDEWTHFDHGPDGNPVSKDRLVGPVRGLQWASYGRHAEPASTVRLGGGAYVRANHAAAGKSDSRTALVAREAANGMLRWMIDEAPGMDAKRSRVFEASWCIDGGRVHGLVGDVGEWGQSLDLATGKRIRVYDQGVPAPEAADNKFASRQSEEERRWKIDVTVAGGSNTRGPYTHGLIHIAADGTIVQGGSVRLEGEPKPYPLGPARYEKSKAPPNEKEPPTSVMPAGLYQGLVAALDPATGKRLWAWDAPQGLLVAHLAGGEGAVAVGLTRATVSLGVHYRNRFDRLAEVVVLDAKTGRPRWRSDRVKDFTSHHVAVAGGGLYVAHHAIYAHIGEMDRMIRFNLRDGNVDFDVTPEIENKNDNWKNRFVVLDGRVRLGGSRKLASFDARTGQDVQQTVTEVPGHGSKYPGFSLGHCSTWRATPNGWLSGRFAHYIPFDGKIESLPAVARNRCDEGHYPAYGLLYSGYHSGCYCATYLVGAVALHSLPEEPAIPDDRRLVRGPAWGTAFGEPAAADQWPTFRANANRGNYVEAKLGSVLKPTGALRLLPDLPPGPIPRDWAGSIMPRVSAPVIAGGLIFVSLVHDRRLVALDAETGKPRWSRPLAARLEYPPTIHRGLAFLGGNDGTVSCLRASDGALVWRFLAAPNRRRIAVAGQTESAWPVPGVVLLRDRLYAAAGRHNQLDGGLHVWCLDPATGAVLGHRVVTGTSCSQPPRNLPPTLNYQGRSNDILAVDRAGRAVHMRDIAIDPKTLEWLNLCTFDRRAVARGRPGRIENAESDEEYAGFKETELAILNTKPLETHDAMYNPGTLNYGSAGLGIKQEWIDYSRKVEGRDMAIGRDRLVAISRGGVVGVPLEPSGAPVLLPRNASKEERDRQRPALTQVYRPFTGVAMTPDRIVLTMPGMVSGNKPPALWLMAPDGKVLAEADLAADPQPAGLAVAGSRIVVVTADGGIQRFSTTD